MYDFYLYFFPKKILNLYAFFGPLGGCNPLRIGQTIQVPSKFSRLSNWGVEMANDVIAKSENFQ